MIFLVTEACPPKRTTNAGGARKGVFKQIFAALYYSRRMQADRVLGRYQRLIDEAQRNIHRELSVRYGARNHVGQ